MGPAEHYRAERLRITELAAGFSDEQLETCVPGCPDWTVRELLSHLTAVAADVHEGRTESAGSPSWTGAQVAARQGRDVGELLAEWGAHGPDVEAAMDPGDLEAWRVAYDAAMHHDDLREALGLPYAVGPTQSSVLDGLVMVAGQRFAAAGLPALTARAGDRDRTAGSGEVAATVTAPNEGELARVFAGRRSAEQLRALDWTGDPEPYLPHLAEFTPGE